MCLAVTMRLNSAVRDCCLKNYVENKKTDRRLRGATAGCQSGAHRHSECY